MHYLSSVYYFNQPLHVSAVFVAHHQEVYSIYTTNWYVLCFLVDRLLVGWPTDRQLRINSVSRWFLLHRYIEMQVNKT